MVTPTINYLIGKLKEAALEGQRAIENGDTWRYQLPDTTFSLIVPSHLEDEVTATMIVSGEWDRCAEGFNLKE